MADTVICATDSVMLTGQSNALHYNWTPAATVASPTKLTTNALPITTTTYHIHATIDHCEADYDVTIKLVPYPVANAGPDTTICFNSAAQLHAAIVGSTFSWTPSNTLNNPNSLNPVATPFGTARYILTVHDTLGCPKPKTDTVVVNVLPKIIPFAGNDTAVVVGQPLQFHATGGISYEWSPSTGLNHTNIHNPLGFYDGSFDSIIYKVIISNEQGCSDSDYVKVAIFKTSPSIFVPTAFTPNGDGKNDVFRPIAVGISKFEYFRVFNRWGQLVFETKIPGRGWDGKIGGKEQGSNTYVWVVKGTDFTGKQVFDKGTVTLIR
jgi:gliding motility-associated-like protein